MKKRVSVHVIIQLPDRLISCNRLDKLFFFLLNEKKRKEKKEYATIKYFMVLRRHSNKKKCGHICYNIKHPTTHENNVTCWYVCAMCVLNLLKRICSRLFRYLFALPQNGTVEKKRTEKIAIRFMQRIFNIKVFFSFANKYCHKFARTTIYSNFCPF